MPLFILDTNILVLHLADLEPVDLSAGVLGVSSVSVYELLRYPGMSFEEKQKIERLLAACIEMPLNSTIARRAAEISMIRPQMKPLDVFIAATAMVYGLPLVTKNTKDFKGVKGLKLRSTV